MMNNYIKCFPKALFQIESNINISKYLLNSSILITDYSSVLFDFWYMKKPAIYYHFHDYHYKDFLNYETELFWYTEHKLDWLIFSLNTIIKNNWAIEKKYSERINNFFYKIDGKNCERNYNKIIKLK
jgi:CDP-glycerol glycerophosphotransferase (TagB/SpsB family)